MVALSERMKRDNEMKRRMMLTEDCTYNILSAVSGQPDLGGLLHRNRLILGGKVKDRGMKKHDGVGSVNIESIRKAYRRYAFFYDLSFGAIFEPGRAAVINRMRFTPGCSVLEVGVGTGLSLPLYPRNIAVTGIDISEEMLEKARRRRHRLGLMHVSLECMDAENMTFPDDSFDAVVAMYVVSVVPNPCKLMDEMRRVCRPGGEIYIVNHFQHEHPFVCGMEKMISPLSRLLGFRPDFSLCQFIKEANIDVVDKSPVNLCGYWTLLTARNNKAEMRPCETSLHATDLYSGPAASTGWRA